MMLFVAVNIAYISYIATQGIFGGLINSISFAFLFLEMFHILDVDGRERWLRKMRPYSGKLSYTPKVSIHVPVYKEPVDVVRTTLEALNRIDYQDYEVCVIVNNTNEEGIWKGIKKYAMNLGQDFVFFTFPTLRAIRPGH